MLTVSYRHIGCKLRWIPPYLVTFVVPYVVGKPGTNQTSMHLYSIYCFGISCALKTLYGPPPLLLVVIASDLAKFFQLFQKSARKSREAFSKNTFFRFL